MGGKCKSINVVLIVNMMQNFISEFMGTAIFVMVGCMGCNNGTGDNPDMIGVALTFSLAIFAAIQISSHVSGGHVNPAVTVLSLFFKRLKWYMAIVYICGQILGAVVGFGLVRFITPGHLTANGVDSNNMCTTTPNSELTLGQAFFIEMFLTSILLLVICTAWDSRNTNFDSMSLKIGFTVFPLVYAGGPYTGCSLNPARSFGPALWNGKWADLWIYLTAPMLASGICGSVYTLLFDPILVKKQELEEEQNSEP